jgi:hypothetical protein
VWVTNPDDRTLLGIDPVQEEIIAVIDIDGRPERAVVEAGAVWVLDRQNDRVIRVNPDRKRVEAYAFIPGMELEALTAAGGSIWAGATGQIDIQKILPGQKDLIPPGYLIRIDPTTNSIAEQITVELPIRQLVPQGNLLWILADSTIDTPLLRLNLITKKVESVTLNNAPDWFLVDSLAAGSDLWLLSLAYGKLFRAAPDAGMPAARVLAAVDIDLRQPAGYPDLLLTGSGLWVSTPWGMVLHIDPVTNHLLGQIDLGVPLSGLFSSGSTVWALSQQTGALFRLDPTSYQVLAQLDTGRPTAPTLAPTPTPRVLVWEPCPDSPTSRLQVGDNAYVNREPPLPNRVREEPNREAESVGWVGPGASMEIVEGPTCSEGWVWWRIETANLSGWTAEGDEQAYWLVPLLP